MILQVRCEVKIFRQFQQVLNLIFGKNQSCLFINHNETVLKTKCPKICRALKINFRNYLESILSQDQVPHRYRLATNLLLKIQGMTPRYLRCNHECQSLLDRTWLKSVADGFKVCRHLFEVLDSLMPAYFLIKLGSTIESNDQVIILRERNLDLFLSKSVDDRDVLHSANSSR